MDLQSKLIFAIGVSGFSRTCLFKQSTYYTITVSKQWVMVIPSVSYAVKHLSSRRTLVFNRKKKQEDEEAEVKRKATEAAYEGTQKSFDRGASIYCLERHTPTHTHTHTITSNQENLSF